MRRTLTLLFLFSVAMGFMESAIVIYLRELYYPGGFKFPLTVIPAKIAIVEVCREAATIVMLIIIGILAGRNRIERFSFFLFSFAVWDIFYYVFLKVFLGWPESFFTPDILFLIPVPWIGPVIAPCILSLTMIALALVVAHYSRTGEQVRISRREWSILLTGTLVVITSFIWDFINFPSASGSSFKAAGGEQLFGDFVNYIPQSFNWFLFIIGELILIAGIYLLVPKTKSS